MPLLPWCWHQRCTPSDIVPPAPGPRYRPSEVGNTHPFENIHVHVHSITSIFISISPDVKQKHSWFFSYSVVLQNMYVSMTCLLRFFFINKIVISALKIICSIFSFPVWIHMTFHSSFLQYFIEMLIEKFPNISKSWALPCLILSLSVQSGSAWTVLIAATDRQTNKQSIKNHTQNSDIKTFHNPPWRIFFCTTPVRTSFVLFDEEAGDGFIVLVNGPVKQRLLTFPWTLRPQIYITTMLYLHEQEHQDC